MERRNRKEKEKKTKTKKNCTGKGCVFWLLHCFSGMSMICRPSNLEVELLIRVSNTVGYWKVFVDANRKLVM